MIFFKKKSIQDSIRYAGNRHICINTENTSYFYHYMDNRQSRIKYLFELYTNKSASADEVEEFFKLSAGDQFNEELKELILNELNNTAAQEDYDQSRWDLVFERIKQTAITNAPVKVKQFKIAYQVAVAAAIAIIVSGACLFYLSKQRQTTATAVQFVKDIAPGKKGATLTLANGKKIALSNAVNGALIKEAGVAITKSAEGQLIYKILSKENGKDDLNTLSTSAGEAYMLILPDKSKVWLNAASSITYTTTLYGRGKHSSRHVKLVGEAYFEIVKDADHPFVVESNGQKVEVLGTDFNISSYPDEQVIKTTLLKGSVKVSDGNMQKILTPGYQAVNSGKNIAVEKADTQLAIAWKNGVFQFYRANVKTVMKQLARWYDVEVEYQGQIPEHEFTGKIYRSVNASEALTILKELDVKFRIEGRKIIVTP